MLLVRLVGSRAGQFTVQNIYPKLPLSLQKRIKASFERIVNRPKSKTSHPQKSSDPKKKTTSEAAKVSETSKVRGSLSKFCIGDGVDIGYGGDPIVPWAICMDLEAKYASYEAWPQHLHGDAAKMYWFSDRTLDWVYSSHVLEDFEDPRAVFFEWWRILKVDGRMVLFLPDEQKYRKYCKEAGKNPNPHHVHADFSPQFVLGFLQERTDWAIEHFVQDSGIYSFELVLRKVDGNSPAYYQE